MYLCHAVGIVGPFLVPFRWSYVGLAVAIYGVRMFALSGGYHRYFAHRSYRTGRGFQFVLGVPRRNLRTAGCPLVGRQLIATITGTPTIPSTSTPRARAASSGATSAGFSPSASRGPTST